MNIAYIGPSGVFGGVRIITEHLNRLERRGHVCTYLHTSPEPITWLRCEFEQRPLMDAGRHDVYVGSSFDTWPLAYNLARANGAQSSALVQMAEWLFFPRNSAGYAAQIEAFKTPLDFVMPISNWLADLCREVEGRDVRPIRNGLDTNLFYPDPDPESERKLRILVEGITTNPAKDFQDMSFGALRRLRYDEGLEFETWGFAQGPQMFEFTHYWQQPPQHIIRRLYSNCDIFLKATRYEGRPAPDLEAMACGLPVCRAIITGGDDLRDGENCLRVDYGDVPGFYANLKRLATEPELREQLRAAGLAYVREYCQWGPAIDAIEHALTGSVTAEVEQPAKHDYDLAQYDALQREITIWETPQAMFLGELLKQELQPKSVIDIGCGPGVYLVPFKPECRVLGVDGAPAAGLALEDGEFVRADLREDWRADTEYDLGLCIEVAEHLPPARAEYLVDLLAASARTVFFSAAAPGQGGQDHLNERPRQYWLDLFAARGYALHEKNAAIVEAITMNEACRKVQWLIPNSFVVTRQP